jgi:uncharacterized protein
VSYVRLKHTLADIALAAIARPHDARTARALVAYAGAADRGGPVSVRLIAAAAHESPSRVLRLLLDTGLFADADGGREIVLASPFLPSAAYFARQVSRLGNALRLLASPAPPGVSTELHRAAALFDAGLFFECHEYLEDVWRATEGPDRMFYHGIVQAAAGCYHLEKRNLHGAGVLIRKGIAKLRPFAPVHRALDVGRLLAGLEAVVSAIDRNAQPPAFGGDEFPVMAFAARSERVGPAGPAPQGTPPRR